MRPQLFAATSVVVSVGLSVACSSGARPSGPALHVEAAAVTRDPLFRGEVLEHTFSVTNRSAITIEILDVVSSCLTQTTFPKKIAPGRTVPVSLAFSTRQASTGMVTPFTARITTAAPDTRTYDLAVSAEVKDEFTPSAGHIDLTGYRHTSTSVRVRTNFETSSRVTKVVSSDPAVKAIVSAEITDRDGSRTTLITLSLQGGAGGRHYGNLIVDTTSALTPQIRIPLTGTVR